MPCNIGYKSIARVQIPAPQPQTFKAKADAPKIDADLLAKLGSEDEEFSEWLTELNTEPLLKEALKRALSKLSIKGIELSVNDKGELEAKGSYVDAKEKKNLSETFSRVSERWQFEILGIVAELLDYEVKITQNGDEFILEAEEEGKSHPCDYIKITKKDGDATVVFEHFKSRKALEVETAKFLSLAQKLGVKIVIRESTTSEGDPFPGENRHTHDHHHHHGHSHNHKH
ncbi:MAG: hypothetical protein A3B86_03615 [Candidatus Yanofskybacteria bacterium RIFCSPHIGHO2_02_FULL_38_22b]|uniref:Uncharacterized protein n=1 Tax=Candidatus Yanofskybacteria bacterium RIFCSPHIGHO2_02_FULL_38_22b TaxID=1802673 RepID=A0A1F8F1E5_9BACT|nr:MAG: hypothetical protein A3B86_03615 [Candidatus Yanofskybacteria bacterium RIFCSPHIGHO2_02_FULL_38_22b]OGN19473.1 MAG: hypothetical protein A2910_02995 [Candidatus Yanofskybacteria bacterium RIFCSPLOWO2_01_FULL_39_28]